jgi:benzoyl-CoA reductase/2-hydroxyglutaryl-CoA dehydratase subunit BcrC/BadD/HgdB
MNPKIEKFGAFISSRLPEHPEQARGILEAAYSAIHFQAGHFPSKKFLSSREYLQSETAGLLTRTLKDPSDAAVVNIFLPCEIFHAMGIPIMAPEVLACYAVNTAVDTVLAEAAEAAGAPQTLCSYHKVLTGLEETGILKKPMMIANTTLACDANQLTFRHLSEKWQVPHIVIDVPYTVDESAVEYVAGQLRSLAGTAEEISGKKLEEDRLKETVARSIRTQNSLIRSLKMRPSRHLPETLTPELLNLLSDHILLGSGEAEQYAKMLLGDLKKAPAHTSEKRILWMHVLPNWQESLKEIFQGPDNHRVEIIASDMFYDSFVRMDPEKPFESMARRAVCGSFNGPGKRRIDRTLEMAEKMQADGILIFCQWGCKETQGISVEAKKAFEEAGYPSLILDGDGCDRRNGGSGQIVTRTMAFVEELEGRS